MQPGPPDHTHEPRPDPQKHKDPDKRREPTQQDLMRKDLPKKDVADSLEDFDGDEA